MVEAIVVEAADVFSIRFSNALVVVVVVLVVVLVLVMVSPVFFPSSADIEARRFSMTSRHRLATAASLSAAALWEKPGHF